MALATEPRATMIPDAEPVMIDVETALTAQQPLARAVALSRHSRHAWPEKYRAALRGDDAS